MNFNLCDIFNNFQHRGTFSEGAAYGNGHINDTFLIKTEEKDCADYILQRINHGIFKDPVGLMRNIELVTGHLRKAMGVEGDTRQVLTLIPSIQKKSYFIDEGENYWRLYLFIWPNRSYDLVPSAQVAREGGKAFGRFQSLLADLKGDRLSETIPHFHNIRLRLAALEEAMARDRAGRVRLVTKEIAFVRSRVEIMSTILTLGEAGELPVRVTHNDTKFNNVLLDENDRQLCVIDLDTVMPGYIHYDFGDSIRTATNAAEEDESDGEKVFCKKEIFKGFAEGFLGETKHMLSQSEKDTLFLAGKTMTYTIGVRFLTDYIEGDVYFKTHRSNQNLDRCRVQFKLVESLEEQEEDLKRIIRNLL